MLLTDRLEIIAAFILFFASVAYIAYRYSEQFLEWLRFQSLGTRDYIVETLSVMFIDVNPNTVLVVMFSMSFGLGAIVFLAFFPQWLPGTLFSAIVTFAGWKAPKPIVEFMYQRRVTL